MIYGATFLSSVAKRCCLGSLYISSTKPYNCNRMLLYLQVLVIFQYEVLELSFMGTSALYASRADAMGKYEQVKKVIDLEKNQIVMTRQSPKRQVLWGVPSM